MPGARYRPDHDGGCRCGGFCIARIGSTPKNPGNHARATLRVVDHCSVHKLLHAFVQRQAKE